ncbi:MAG: heavy-metal-associated domain-containing protein [Cytophagaceae bacterium]|nr:heavy-metal-associated domain-containing protein [Cytophagaceae bacterium]MDW8456841.1 heavy-metal-associated domain-containing protein [Cytophagaceae bacterium]
MKAFGKVACVITTIACLVSCQLSPKQGKKAEFYVRGNCGMCKERIEATAMELKGVWAAEWNTDTKLISVEYDSTQIAEIDIHKALAGAGHGTQKIEMDTTAHNDLPECCKVGNHM